MMSHILPVPIGRNSMMMQRKSSGHPSTPTNSSSMGDEKYTKRRDHRSQERRRNTVLMLATALVILFLTYRYVSRDQPGHDARGDDGHRAPHHRSNINNKFATTGVARRARGAPRIGDDGGRTRFDHPDTTTDAQHQHHGADGGNNAGHREHQRRKYEIVAGVQRREKKVEEEEEEEEEENNDGGNFFFFWKQKVTPLQRLLKDMDEQIVQNADRGIRWINPQLVPALDSSSKGGRRPLLKAGSSKRALTSYMRNSERQFFKAARKTNAFSFTPSFQRMAWEDHDEASSDNNMMASPRDSFVDYTKHQYEYPTKLMDPPAQLGDYPKLMPLKEIMDIWPQDDIDHPPSTLHEELIHFDYTDPMDLTAAHKFREAKLPFKLVNVPEVVAAGIKWTDEYLSDQFDGDTDDTASGGCQESPDNYFAWFQQPQWNVDTMGIPPTRDNDWTFAKWAQHARYADRVGLSPYQPHFYWQSGASKDEQRLHPSDQSFISRDLPSFSSLEQNFLLFEPTFQKGIQCRFGERGVTAATHFDGGRNMVAMIHGAKRYILSPPRECPRLGIVTTRGNAIYRHSMLNFGHLNHMDNPDMPSGEREWMEESGHAEALSTVLKAGEVLYIPSHWFHYITSLQKSAQCNVRSGIDEEGDPVFGGKAEVTEKCIR